MPTYTNQNTGTAADLLSYDTYADNTTNSDELTRVATATEEWVVKETGGEVFFIKFDKNFSKKHFVTKSKKANAPADSVDLKIAKTLGHRAKSNVCNCNHKIDKHNNQGPCKTCGKNTCGSFQTSYGKYREKKGKPKYDPLAGQPTKKNTCIVLNNVPKADFEKVVLGSILAHEKPPTWKTGDALAMKVNDDVELEWDFGVIHKGAVVQAESHKAPKDWDAKQGCKIKAKKTGTGARGQTWEIYHMSGVI